METMTVTKIFTSVFTIYLTVQSFITIKWQEKNISMIKILNFLFLTILNQKLTVAPAKMRSSGQLKQIVTNNTLEKYFASIICRNHVDGMEIVRRGIAFMEISW